MDLVFKQQTYRGATQLSTSRPLDGMVKVAQINGGWAFLHRALILTQTVMETSKGAQDSEKRTAVELL